MFIAHALHAGIHPVLAPHLLLLPMNAYRPMPRSSTVVLDTPCPRQPIVFEPMRHSVCLLTAFLVACSTASSPAPWQPRLHGDAIVLLGEVHDNAGLHRLRLEALRRAFAAGWRPAIVLEQFDRERQADIDRARRERPTDAQHVIDAAGGDGWDWRFYRPFVELALTYDVPLIAANLSNADTAKVVRSSTTAVFDSAAAAALGLDRDFAADWQQAQEHEIDLGHCGALPASLWPRMARAQFARDAVMAQAIRAHEARGVVLLAGNGHTRRDLGVPRWLDRGSEPGRIVAIGFVEDSDDSTPAAAFDAVVRAAAAERADPCAGFVAPRVGG